MMSEFEKEQVLFKVEVHRCIARMLRLGMPRAKAVDALLARLRHASQEPVPAREVDALLRRMSISREEAVRAIAVAAEMKSLRAQGRSYLQAIRVLRRRVAQATPEEGSRATTPIGCPDALAAAHRDQRKRGGDWAEGGPGTMDVSPKRQRRGEPAAAAAAEALVAPAHGTHMHKRSMEDALEASSHKRRKRADSDCSAA